MPETSHFLTEPGSAGMPPQQSHRLAHDQRVPGHAHDEGHLVYPATGVLSLVTPDGSWIAPPNRCVWVPSGHEHHHRAHGSTVMRVAFLSAPLAAELPTHPAVLTVSPLAREALLALTDDDADRSDAAREHLRLVILDEVATAPEQPLHLPEPHDDRLQAVIRHVESDLAEPATLQQIGRRVGAAERTLSRLFHQETGMGFRQWRTQARIHHALLLLADGVSVVDTATACGWSNPSGFIDAFTDLVGQTPGQYRRSLSAVGS